MMHPPNKEYDCGWKEYSIVGVGRQVYEGCWDVWVRQSTWRSEHDARKGHHYYIRGDVASLVLITGGRCERERGQSGIVVTTLAGIMRVGGRHAGRRSSCGHVVMWSCGHVGVACSQTESML